MIEAPWKQYRRTGLSEMRPHVPGEDMGGISVSIEDVAEVAAADASGQTQGGMIARNPVDHADQWYVSAEYFAANLEEA